MLPEKLLSAIEQETDSVSHLQLMEASKNISNRYRQRTSIQNQRFLLTDVDRLAYLAVRMPATYAVIHRVLREIQKQMPEWEVQSFLDIGSGPGTAMWAVQDLFSTLKSITLWEQDPGWISLGKRLANHADHTAIKNASWQEMNVLGDNHLQPHDLVMLSYVIGELPKESLEAVVAKAWEASQVVVFIEPGTPDGFQRILMARNRLIALGANLVAPCPHALECPLNKIGDWCHFSERLERSSLHREIKDVSMGFEDEKYSYVVGSKTSTIHPLGRIVRTPQRRSGHVVLTLCTSEGLKQRVVSRREGEIYKKARKLDWGDPFLT